MVPSSVNGLGARRWLRRGAGSLLALACAAPVQLGAQVPDSVRAAQAAAMQRLDYMVGTWRGEGWIDYGGRRLTFRGSEQVQRKLGGLALLVEGNFLGRAPGADREVPVHTTLAVISYAPAASRYQFDTWLATGAQGEHELALAENGWQWEIHQPAGRIRYVMRLTPEGEWLETGERSADGTTWRQFFEMRLRK